MSEFLVKFLCINIVLLYSKQTISQDVVIEGFQSLNEYSNVDCGKYQDVKAKFKFLKERLNLMKLQCHRAYYAFSQDIFKDLFISENKCSITNSNRLLRRVAYMEDLIRKITDICLTNTEIVGQDFKFDRSTLHRNRYISKDGKTISNYKLSTEMQKGSGSLRNYEGVRGTKGFSQFDNTYYEVDVYYKILSNVSERDIVFELGFSTKETIDDHHYVGKQNESWSLFAYVKKTKNSLIMQGQVGNRERHTVKPLSSDTVNTTFHETFAFHVNGPQREITIFGRQDNSLEKLYTFTDVDFVQQIYPVFGLYNSILFYISFKLKTKQSLKQIPKGLHDL